MFLFYKNNVPRSKIKVKCLFCRFEIGNLEKNYSRLGIGNRRKINRHFDYDYDYFLFFKFAIMITITITRRRNFFKFKIKIIKI